MRSAVLVVLAVSVIGCSNSSPPATSGAGGATGTGGSSSATGTGGAAGVGGSVQPGTGGATTAPGSGGATTSAGSGGTTTGSGGATTGSGGATTGSGGTSGSGDFTPLCSGLTTEAGAAPTKGGACTESDPQLCYKTCGPESKGFKSETCTAGAYAEQSGCSFPEGDYSCYEIPATEDPGCPTTAPQASTACSVAACVVCGGSTGYLDSSGASKTGYCVCPESSSGNGKWSCASTTAWPCQPGSDCSGGTSQGGAGGSTTTGGGGTTTGAGGEGGAGGSTTGAGGSTEGSGGSTTGSGGSSETGSGGATSGSGGEGGAGGSTTGSGGSSGSGDFTPLCSGLTTEAGAAPTKNGVCTDADPQLCYKTCGPESKGFKSETCTAGTYVEQSGCSFPEADYSCYKIPETEDPSCPTTAPQASTACSVAACVPCGGSTGYLDSSGTSKTGYCVCPESSSGNSKWSCASTSAWPCPGGSGC